MASSTTPIPRMRADWTPSGACIRGSTARRRGATRRACGGAVTTSTTKDEHDADVRGVVPWHVGRNDGGDDAAVPDPGAVALPPGRLRLADGARGRRLFLRLDRVRNGRLATELRAGARHTDRARCGRPDGRLLPVDPMEGASARLLPGGWAWPGVGGRRHGLASG